MLCNRSALATDYFSEKRMWHDTVSDAAKSFRVKKSKWSPRTYAAGYDHSLARCDRAKLHSPSQKFTLFLMRGEVACAKADCGSRRLIRMLKMRVLVRRAKGTLNKKAV